MKDLVTIIFGGSAILTLVVLLLIIVPVIFLWCINSLAEAGGSSFYINHNVWNYFVSFVFIALLNTTHKDRR